MEKKSTEYATYLIFVTIEKLAAMKPAYNKKYA